MAGLTQDSTPHPVGEMRAISYGQRALSARLGRCFRRLRSRLSLGPGRSSAGQGLVEFALILPFLLLLILGIIEFSYVFAAYTSLFNAAREGARYGVVQPMDQTGIVSKARGKVFLANPNAVDIYMAYDDGPDTTVFTDTADIQVGQSRVIVYVTHDLPTITPVIHALWPEFHIETVAARTIASGGDIASVVPGGAWPPPENPFGPGGGGPPDEPPPTGGSTASIELDVTAPEMVYSGPDNVSFSYEVRNTGDVDLENVAITYDLGSDIAVGNLAAGASASAPPIPDATLDETTTINFTARGYDPVNEEWVFFDTSITVTVIHPALALEVKATPKMVARGGSVTFTYIVTNTGDVALTSVVVTDTLGFYDTVDLLEVGATVYWEKRYSSVLEDMESNAFATGIDPLGNPVRDSDSVVVVVLEEFAPIDIQEPLYEGDTVVAGTAEPDQILFIQDLMNRDFPSPANNSTVVQADGTFAFAGLPALVAGDVIRVYGYSQDDAVVYGLNLAPIEISEPLCHGSTAITGTAEPGRTIELLIPALGYGDRATVDADGNFAFGLYGGLTLQIGQSVVVNGYGESSGEVYVVWCGGLDPYIVITPQCGRAVPNTTISVDGYNWGEDPNRRVKIFWNGEVDPKTAVDLGNKEAAFSDEAIVVDVPAFGEYAVRAELWIKSGKDYVYTGDYAEATFVSPCPSPNLVITDLQLYTTEPISTYQCLDFVVTVGNIGTMPANNLFWVDLYANEAPALEKEGVAWAAVSVLGVGDSTLLTITHQSGFTATGAYEIWALVDSRAQVSELDEEDNEYGSIMVQVTEENTPPEPPTPGNGVIEGETWVSISGIPVPHGRATVHCFDTSGEEVATVTSEEDASYRIEDLEPGTYTIIGETWIDGVRYSNLYEIEVYDSQTTILFIFMS